MGGTKARTGSTALVTGASSGIGEALARRFARGGCDVVLVARRVDRLRALARVLAADYGVRAIAVGADLAQPGSAARLAAAMQRRRLAIDILVNNAGVLAHGPFTALPASRHQAMIDLNVSGLTAMLAHFLPPMVARGDGRVLNVASISAFQPVPTLATYAATKAYVLSLTESLAEELAGTGVSATALCPGFTRTAMMTRAADESAGVSRLPDALIGDVDAVAEEGYAACLAREVISVPGGVNRATVLATRAAPKWLVRRLLGALSRRTL